MDVDAVRSIEQDCARVVTVFFVRLDTQEYEKLWDQMTSDGCWERGGKNLNSRKLFLETMAERPKVLTIRHMISNLLVETASDGSSAVATFNLLVYRYLADRGDKPAPMGTPTAISAFTARMKPEKGIWRIAHLSGETLFAS